MIKILVVEDEKAINDLITMNLKLAGYSFTSALNGAEANQMIANESFDLLLLDVLLPEITGFELAKRIQNKNISIPIIFITAKDSLSDRMMGFDLGAEDYIIKPFEVMELLARIHVVLRRNNVIKQSSEFFLQDTKIVLSERKAYYRKNEVELTAQEFTLLEVLIQNKNIALSRDKLLELAWGYDYEGDTRTVDVHIRKLRQKLGWEEQIKTIYKFGYRLEVLA